MARVVIERDTDDNIELMKAAAGASADSLRRCQECGHRLPAMAYAMPGAMVCLQCVALIARGAKRARAAEAQRRLL